VISAVGIVVPARDERRRVLRCVRGLVASMRALPPHIDTAICLVADRCADDTVSRARTVLRADQILVNHAARTIGEIRDLGCRHVLSALDRHDPAEIVLLSTDADSVVAPDWASAHLRLVDAGAAAVAGMVELVGKSLTPRVAARHATVLARSRRHDGHGNVYAANLAVRADAYLAVGGFGAVACGEDQALWRRIGAAGHHRRYVTEPVVRTSARRRGRARGGLADLLNTLHGELSA
jgi:hypothetical protein